MSRPRRKVIDLDQEIASLRNAIEAELGGLSETRPARAASNGVAGEFTARARPRRRRRRLRHRLIDLSGTLAFYAGLILLIVVIGILAVHGAGNV